MNSVSADMSEVHALGRQLRAAGPKIGAKLQGRLTANANSIARAARAAAPKDRPWLSTPAGIRVDTPRTLTRRIYSPLDDTKPGKPQSVGYRVEYGTSKMAPRPFLGPAMAQGREKFNKEAMAILVANTL